MMISSNESENNKHLVYKTTKEKKTHRSEQSHKKVHQPHDFFLKKGAVFLGGGISIDLTTYEIKAACNEKKKFGGFF